MYSKIITGSDVACKCLREHGPPGVQQEEWEGVGGGAGKV